MNSSPKSVVQTRLRVNPEAGFMLIFVVVLAALLLIALAVAAPVVAKDLRRDKELESEHRAEQYVRAIRLYYRKFKTYPASMDALQNTNNIRFLRKKYVDPLTGKDDWRIIHVGENKTTVKGFFGEPLGGLNTTGAGGGLGSASTLGTGFGGTSSSGSTAGTSTPGTTVSGGSALSAGFSGATIGGGTSGGAGGSATGLNSGLNSSSTTSGGMGVGQIMGVGTSRTGDSILDPNEQTTYETWEFIYDPRIEMLYQQANILGGAAGGSVNSTGLANLNSNLPNSTPNNTPNNTPAPTPPSQPPTNAPF